MNDYTSSEGLAGKVLKEARTSKIGNILNDIGSLKSIMYSCISILESANPDGLSVKTAKVYSEKAYEQVFRRSESLRTPLCSEGTIRPFDFAECVESVNSLREHAKKLVDYCDNCGQFGTNGKYTLYANVGQICDRLEKVFNLLYDIYNGRPQ